MDQFVHGGGSAFDIYVTIDGHDTNNNGTILKPYATVQKALNEIANLPDNGQSKMHVRVNIGPGRFNEEVVWNLPYNWGAGNKTLRCSILGAGMVAGVNTTYLRSLTINQHDQANVGAQIGLNGIVIDPESGSPPYGLTFVDHPNRNFGTYINLTDCQVWAGGTGRGSLYVDATTNGAGSGGLSRGDQSVVE